MIKVRIPMMGFLVVLASAVSGCNGAESATSASIVESTPKGALPDTSASDPANPLPGSPGGEPVYATDVMIFNGIGISTSDWQTTEQIVKSAGLSYELVNSSQLDAMTLDELANFGVMVFPGGYGNQITDGVTAATGLKVRKAVRDRGVSLLGICAGAWVAVGPESATDKVADYGFAVANGKMLDEYFPDGREPVAAMVDVSFSNGSIRNLVWWGGPITPNWANGVVARYETGDPAISQTWSGKGFVIVSGPHPEAPQGWRSTAGYDADGLDYDIATKLIKAALDREPLPVFF